MDTDPKPILSKLAILSLVIPSFLAISPYILLLLFNFIFGPYPSDKVDAVLARMRDVLHLSSDRVVSIPPFITVFVALLLAIPAIVHVRKSHGTRRGYLWPITSLILIPLYFLEGLILTMFLFAEIFL